MKYFPIILGLMCLFSCRPTTAQNNLTKVEEKIDSIFNHVKKTNPGYMIAVIQDTSFLFKKGYGMANLEYQIPISQYSAFNIASLSKQFTAACLAILILEDRVSLEDNIRDYVPEFPEYPQEIKLKHLVYMTSGINDYYYTDRKNGMDWSSLHFFNIDTAITASLNEPQLMYDPGTKWSYSNINYMLLTKVVEKVSGISFARFAKDRLFQPLGMTNTFVNDDIFQVIPGRVNGYNFRTQENTNSLNELGYLKSESTGLLQIPRVSPHYGGSGVYTTMEDFKKWISNMQTQSFGGQAFHDLMHQSMTFEHDKNNDLFGLYRGDFNGQEIIAYEGGDWGFSSFFMRFPKYNTTIVCFSNFGSGQSAKYAYQVTDVLLEEGCLIFR